jgi:hypothetical protein
MDEHAAQCRMAIHRAHGPDDAGIAAVHARLEYTSETTRWAGRKEDRSSGAYVETRS